MSLDTDEFARLLSSELDASRQLNELLQQELSVVTSHQPMALDTLNPAKEKQVAILRASAGLRLDWMEANQLPVSSECLDHPDIATCKVIATTWQQLAACYESNREISARLSELVLALRFRAEQKLKILHARHNDPHLYNDKGKAAGNSTGFKSIEA